MCRAYVKMEPLTPEEQTFAEENHSLLLWCIKDLGADVDEFYGAASIGYLKAVKNWFSKPDIQKHSFSTIARYSIRGYIGNERRKMKRGIRAVSLDEIIRGTDGCTMHGSISYDHMNYLYEEKGDSGMALKMNYDIEIPPAARLGRTPSVEIEKLLEFLESKHTTMSFEYSSNKEASGKRSTLSGWKKNNKREDFNIYKMAETIYIEKVKPKQTGRKQICQ